MRFCCVALIGLLLCSVQSVTANDPVDALGACSGNLFGLLMTRLQQMVEDFTACRQEATANDPQHDRSDSIQRAKVDLQQQLVNYSYCTKNIQ
uniref:Uncharacterized protein n=1 Tax=Anopheles gambiae TaxID=7165 RepID=Q8WR28_ANOGA|nr:hypothetical protein 12 [Anopheles gambiae]